MSKESFRPEEKGRSSSQRASPLASDVIGTEKKARAVLSGVAGLTI